MNALRYAALAVAVIWVATALAEPSEAMSMAAPREVSILIAGFGTIESMSPIDKWLGEQLQPRRDITPQSGLAAAEALPDSDISRDAVRLDWNTRRLVYVRDTDSLVRERAKNAAMLRALRTRVLTDETQRYVPMAKDYLQAALSRKARGLLRIIDRGSVDASSADAAIGGNGDGRVAGVSCILTATCGDRERGERVVPVDGKGTTVTMITHTKPYTYKVRDLDGNVLLAESGEVSCRQTANSVVQSSDPDPARKLTEAMCDKIADSLVAFFTTELKVRVKVPGDMDADDVEIAVGGRVLDADEVRVLAVEHLVRASLEGCKTVRKVVEVEAGEDTKPVKITLKKGKKTE